MAVREMLDGWENFFFVPRVIRMQYEMDRIITR